MPKISLLAPSFNLHTTHQSEVGADTASHATCYQHARMSVWQWGETHSVLEARLVSSCFSFPSSARPRFSRLLARNGVSVKTLQKVELGATTSLQTESDQAHVGGAGGARGVGQDSLGLLGGHRTLVLSRVEKADVCVLPHCQNTEQPSAAPPTGRTRRAGVLAYLRSSSSSPSCWCCW